MVIIGSKAREINARGDNGGLNSHGGGSKCANMQYLPNYFQGRVCVVCHEHHRVVKKEGAGASTATL